MRDQILSRVKQRMAVRDTAKASPGHRPGSTSQRARAHRDILKTCSVHGMHWQGQVPAASWEFEQDAPRSPLEQGSLMGHWAGAARVSPRALQDPAELVAGSCSLQACPPSSSKALHHRALSSTMQAGESTLHEFGAWRKLDAKVSTVSWPGLARCSSQPGATLMQVGAFWCIPVTFDLPIPFARPTRGNEDLLVALLQWMCHLRCVIPNAQAEGRLPGHNPAQQIASSCSCTFPLREAASHVGARLSAGDW